MLARLFTDLGHALTSVRRRPAALAVPALTMAIGIGASTAIFSALYAAIFNPLPFPEPDRLVMGRATFSGDINPWASAPDYFDYRERSAVFESLAAYRPSAFRVTIRKGDGAESVLLGTVSWELFRTLGVKPALGRPFDESEGAGAQPQVAIVSDGYWRRSLGGTRDVIGQTLPVNIGTQAGTVTVVGVMPPGFRFAYDADLWVPMQRTSADTSVRRFHNWMLLGRLKPGVSVGEAQRHVDAISTQLQQEYPDSNRNKALLLTDLQEALAEGDRPNLLILMAAVAVLLLVACADVAGLLLSRGAARETEMAIRSALGATRGRLGTQLLAESLIVAVAAGALGLLLAMWLRVLVLRFVPLDALGVVALPLGGPVLAFALGVTVLTSLLIGIVPALVGARSNLAGALKSGTRTTEPGARALFRQGLVALQVTMSVILLAAAALLSRSLLQLQSVDPGFRADNLLTARVQLPGGAYPDAAARVRFFDAFLADLRALPGVTQANITNMVPILDRAGNVPAWDADHPPAQTTDAPAVCSRFVYPGYFATMGIPLVAGRDLSEADAGVFTAGRNMSVGEGAANAGPPVMVISQSVARRLFADANPLGRRMGIFTGGPEPVVAEVVGVVGDVHMNSLGSEYTLAMYTSYRALAQPTMRVVMRTAGDPASVVSAVRAALARRDRGLVLTDVRTMDEILEASLDRFRLRAGAVVLFGAATLLLAMLGVYGVLAFIVAGRRQDIGLRMAIGASRWHVLGWVMARGMAPVGIGLVLGLAGAFGAGRWLRGELFNVPPADILTIAGVVACLAAAAVAACLVPAWRAMHVDPIVALRAE
jgi:putative ABC transport system permease protein